MIPSYSSGTSNEQTEVVIVGSATSDITGDSITTIFTDVNGYEHTFRGRVLSDLISYPIIEPEIFDIPQNIIWANKHSDVEKYYNYLVSLIVYKVYMVKFYYRKIMFSKSGFVGRKMKRRKGK